MQPLCVQSAGNYSWHGPCPDRQIVSGATAQLSNLFGRWWRLQSLQLRDRSTDDQHAGAARCLGDSKALLTSAMWPGIFECDPGTLPSLLRRLRVPSISKPSGRPKKPKASRKNLGASASAGPLLRPPPPLAPQSTNARNKFSENPSPVLVCLRLILPIFALPTKLLVFVRCSPPAGSTAS